MSQPVGDFIVNQKTTITLPKSGERVSAVRQLLTTALEQNNIKRQKIHTSTGKEVLFGDPALKHIGAGEADDPMVLESSDSEEARFNVVVPLKEQIHLKKKAALKLMKTPRLPIDVTGDVAGGYTA